ncbi:hypothetical protein B0T19DRAFT_486683 [Cercophora scortea]|uniref:NACHT domain-containing protein n=1 Tax=Cercophora scortea TaxID=314031 RepID=A0AAE0MA25_9PEZI|nr:hypothetical protein B0T19DRAFT_486683 [Cercophora scortea]
MDGPFTVLGLAGNIVKFVDFTWRLFAETHTIYNSTSGLSQENADLETIARHLTQLTLELSASPSSTKELRGLSHECQAIAQELCDAISRLKPRAGDGIKTWASFTAALRAVWKQGKITHLCNRLSKMQVQLAAHVQGLILTNVSAIGKAVQQIQSTGIRLGIEDREDLTELLDLKRRIEIALSALVNERSEKSREQACLATQNERAAQGPPPTEPQAVESDISAQLKELSDAMNKLHNAGPAITSSHKLLEALHFKDMQTRHRRMAEAHGQTFRWVFEQPTSETQAETSVVQTSEDEASVPTEQAEAEALLRSRQTLLKWLQAGTESLPGIFWVQGKAGSGKSTLMKFLSGCPDTMVSLRQWAGSATLMMASFYFWSPGTRLQKSQEGLLRSILFQLLCDRPDLIRVLNHDPRWMKDYFEKDEDEDGAWTFDTLLAMYRKVMSHDTDTRFCFFIDGLDECEEEMRSHADLIRLLQDLACSRNVKVCVSSRPWTEFVDEFGKNPDWLLKLEDQTRNDMYIYVSERFQGNNQYQKLSQERVGYVELIEEVVDRSQGVFLWVVLVVRELLKGITYRDNLKTLRAELERIPKDLDLFFKNMLRSVRGADRRQSMQMFEIATSAPGPMLLMFYSYLQEANESQTFPLDKPPVVPLDEDGDIRRAQERMYRQLDKLTKGLLEPLPEPGGKSSFFNIKVDFLHRTVKEFLQSLGSQGISSLFDGEQEKDLVAQKTSSSSIAHKEEDTNTLPELKYPHVLACRALLAQIKHAPFEDDAALWLDRMLRDLFFFYRLAYPTSPAASDYLLTLLHDAEHSYSTVRKAKKYQLARSQANIFLGVAAQHNALPFLRHKIQTLGAGPLMSGPGRPLLDYVLGPSTFPITRNSPDVVGLLLEHGARPNQRYENSTVWVRFLDRLQLEQKLLSTAVRSQGSVFQITQQLLEFGAKLNQRVFIMAADAAGYYGAEYHYGSQNLSNAAAQMRPLSATVPMGNYYYASPLRDNRMERAVVMTPSVAGQIGHNPGGAWVAAGDVRLQPVVGTARDVIEGFFSPGHVTRLLSVKTSSSRLRILWRYWRSVTLWRIKQESWRVARRGGLNA